MTRRQGLCVRGGWEGHDPVGTVDLMVSRLGRAGLDLEVADSLDVLAERGRLERYQVIVPAWTMGELGPEASAAIDEAVRLGVGLAGWHGGMGDAFRADTRYQFITGGQFVAHPGDIIEYSVEVIDGGHPIMRDVPGTFAVRSEQYYMHVDPGNRVLAETRMVGPGAEWIAGVRMPVVWTRSHGRGRVAYSSLGHTMADFAVEPCVTLAERCILWAAGMLGS